VVNIDEVEGATRETGTKFGSTMRWLGQHTGGKAIGCTHYEVAPGRSAFPAHYHCANEEAIFVLEGTGSLRLGEAHIELRPGDYVTFPTGPEHPHRLTNTGAETLRYLCMSTRVATEIVGYPDSGKVGVLAIAPGKTWQDPPWVRGIFPADASVGYFDGEEIE
jgi:uncharacterized cupin superfamily protein